MRCFVVDGSLVQRTLLVSVQIGKNKRRRMSWILYIMILTSLTEQMFLSYESMILYPWQFSNVAILESIYGMISITMRMG